MEKNKKVWIRGNEDYPEKVISKLVEFGGTDTGFLEGSSSNSIYFINSKNEIDYTKHDFEFGKVLMEEYAEIKLEEKKNMSKINMEKNNGFEHSIGLNILGKKILKINQANGWGDKQHEVGTNLMLIVSELAEAMEADRKDKYTEPNMIYNLTLNQDDTFKEAFEATIKDKFEDEIADTIIRCLDLCARRNIDIDRHVELKLKYNSTRGYHHGNKKY